jgi:hypothetical protein
MNTHPMQPPVVSGKSDYVLQAPTSFERTPIRLDAEGRSDSDANFQTCQFDPGLRRDRDPIAYEGCNSGGVGYGGRGGPEENESRSPKVNSISGGVGYNPSDGLEANENEAPESCSTLSINSADIAVVFQSFGVTDPRKNKATGVHFGIISGSHAAAPRLITRKNWWVFNSDVFRSFLHELSEGPRDGRRIARKAAVALFHFYYLHDSDAEIFERYPTLFKNVFALKTFRQEMFRRGCSRFGETQDPFGPWKGRHNDPVWIQFRDEQEQKKQQKLEESRALRAGIDNQGSEDQVA